MSACACTTLRFLGKQQSHGGDCKQDADDGKSITETHDKSLPLDHPAERYDGLLRSCCVIRYTMRDEIAC